MEHNEISFVPLLIVIALAFLTPLFLTRFQGLAIPIVVGEIMAGIIVGQSGLGLVEEGQVLRILSVLGFSYLMFLSGLEIDFQDVLSNGKKENPSGLQQGIGNPFVLGAALFVLTLLGSTLVAFFLHSRGIVKNPWFMALILSTTSLGVVVPVLKERHLTNSRYGQAILVSSLIADFASILLISVYVLLHREGLTMEILLVLVLFAAFVIVHRLAIVFQKHLPTERIFEELSSATSQLKLRGTFALALVFIALAESLGIENILGAFLAGVIVAVLSQGEGSILRQKLDAVGYGFFIPIFFIVVGVRFDLPALLSSPSSLLLVPVLLGFAYVVKSVPALLYRLEYSWRETLAAGVLLSSRLSLIIAAAAIGLELGIVSSATNSAIILVAIITCTVSPILFNRFVPATEETHNRVIVVGSRQSGELLRQRLREHDVETVLISDDHDRQEQQTLVTGDVSPWSQQTLLERLRQEDAERARSVVAIEENDQANLHICRMARHTFGIENLIAWVQDPIHNERFRALGVRVVNPAYSTVLILESMVLNPEAHSMTDDVDQAQEVREVKLQNPQLFSRQLNDLMLPNEVAVLMIERNGEILVPDRSTMLRANDTVTLGGVGDEVDDIRRFFARR